MKAFLLAAGEGTRLRPLTQSIPKCLIPIQGTPLLAIWLDLLARSGFDEVLVNLHHLPERVTDFLSRHDSKLRVETRYEPTLLGSAGTVLANRDFVDGERDFLVAYADNLTNAPLADMCAFHRSREEEMTLGVTRTDRPSEKGILVVDDSDTVVAFEEKPKRPRSDLANAGIYVARPGIFDAFAEVRTGAALDFGFHVLPALAHRSNVYRISSFLMDIGTPEAYDTAQRTWPGG